MITVDRSRSRRTAGGALAPRHRAAGRWLAGACLSLALGGAQAQQDEEMLGTFSDWQAMRYVEDGSQVCAMWTDPTRSSARKAHAFVAHRRGPRSFNEVSVSFGVELRDGSKVEATIDKQRFELYTDGDSAWNPSAGEDRRMVDAMRAGAELTVRGTAADGTTLSDTYSLMGFTAAHRKLDEACQVR